MSITVWISLAGLAISVASIILTFVKFGREVHIDDKREIIAELGRCRDRCKEIGEKYEKLQRDHEDLKRDYREMKEENHKLYQRIVQLNGKGDR